MSLRWWLRSTITFCKHSKHSKLERKKSLSWTRKVLQHNAHEP